MFKFYYKYLSVHNKLWCRFLKTSIYNTVNNNLGSHFSHTIMVDSLKSMLKSAKNGVADVSEARAVLVVLGNETCDLDSAVSSLVYSLLLRDTRPADEVVVPVLNIPREQLPLKTEVTYLLNKHGIDLDDLVCRDEIDLRQLLNERCLRLTLVDHHVLPPSDGDLVVAVETVLDHRPQDPAWAWAGADATVRTVASCCTLVANRVLDLAPGLLTPPVAEMLLGAVLLDSACLSVEAGRAQPEDLAVAERLRSLCGSHSQLFNELQAAKSDVSGLTTAQLLIKDLKVTAGIPIAGLPIRVEELLRRPDVRDAVRNFCSDHSCSACVIYGSTVINSTVLRDLAVFSYDSSALSRQIVAALTSSKEPDFDLQPQPCLVEGFELFKQMNVKLTRKQMLPLVREVGEKAQALASETVKE